MGLQHWGIDSKVTHNLKPMMYSRLRQGGTSVEGLEAYPGQKQVTQVIPKNQLVCRDFSRMATSGEVCPDIRLCPALSISGFPVPQWTPQVHYPWALWTRGQSVTISNFLVPLQLAFMSPENWGSSGPDSRLWWNGVNSGSLCVFRN